MKNTVLGQLASAQSVQQVIQPKLKLNVREMELFGFVTSSRESSSWSDNDLWVASTLAQVMWQLEEVKLDLEAEEVTQRNERGTRIANPLFAVQTQLLSQLQALNKTLGLSASQRGLSGAPQQSRNQADAHARAIINKASEDSLLA
jgi:hypothetical protein